MGWQDAPVVSGGGGWASAPLVDDKPAPAKDERNAFQNFSAGAVRGAGSIGATLLAPFDAAARAVGVENDYIGRRDRRESMTQSLGDALGFDTDSTAFGVGKLTGEIAGTAGAGGVLANGVRMLAPAVNTMGGMSRLNAVAQGLESGGFSVGAAGLPTRLATGAASGAATVGLANPGEAASGAAIGAVLPPAMLGAGRAGQMASDAMRSGANKLMQSAIKPTIAQLRSGDARTAAEVLLERGLNPNARGVEKLGAIADDIDGQISQLIAGSNATIDKQAVVGRLNQTANQFGRQVAPQADLRAVQGVADDFLSHPQFPLPQTQIPVQAAQDLKRGTYQVLGKKYGEMKGAETEAQKALARGLKEEIAAAVPQVNDLNRELSRIIAAKQVAERRAMMELNKNPMGLGLLAPTPAGFAAFMADRSALVKSLAARGMNSAAPTGGLLDDSMFALPYVRGGLLALTAN